MTVFGRLDILYPDGRQETHTLAGAAVTVGRAGDNDIRVDHPDIARRHFRLSHRAGIVRLTDFATEGNRTRILNEVETLDIGDLRLTFYQRSDSATVEMTARGDKTQPLAVGLRARLDRDKLPVWPASSADIEVTITNLRAERAEILLETEGLPRDWLSPARLIFPLDAAETSQLRLRIKPTPSAEALAGDYPLTIKLSTQDQPERVRRLTALVAVGAIGGLSLDLAPAKAGDETRFEIYMLNLGNAELSLRLSLHDPRDALDLSLSQSRVTLAAGAPATINAQVALRRRPLIGGEKALPFAIQAHAESDSEYLVALPGSVPAKPRLSYRQLGIFAVIAAIIALIVGLLLPAPAPEIVSFNISPDAVAQGTPVDLRWTANDVERFIIEVDRAPIVELPADANAFTLPTHNYADPVAIALIAINGDQTVIATRELAAYEPVSVDAFAADRDTMLRHVNDRLTVHWVARGAVDLSVHTPPGFETVSARGLGEAQGEITLRGAPAAPFQLVLSALDEAGARSERSIEIAMREPECLPIADAAIRSGPDPRFPRKSIAIQNVPVLVRGATATQDWLMVELASGERGWALTARFSCQGFDPAALRVIRDLPPTPTAEPTPSPTATLAPTATPLPTSTPTPAASPTPEASPTAAGN